MSTKPASEGRQRLLTMQEVLCGYAAIGATNKELAEACGTSAVNASRDMAELIAKGWARKNEDTGRFHPTTHFARLFNRVQADFDRLESRTADQRRAMSGF